MIMLSWLDELILLPQLVFGRSTLHGDWHESMIETLVALLVWIVVFRNARRILNRVYFLEGFLTVCAWCKKIKHDDQWIPPEEYVKKGFRTGTSHGMCPACAATMTNEAEAKRR
jgi:hypothetical protein